MSAYLIIKAVHIISIIIWVGGMIYLPRIFAYHSQVKKGTEADKVFITMESRILRLIINPAMIIAFITGLSLIVKGKWVGPETGWLHAKITLVVIMAGLHGYYASLRKKFVKGNKRPEKLHWLIVEAPTIILIAVIFLVIMKPF